MRRGPNYENPESLRLPYDSATIGMEPLCADIYARRMIRNIRNIGECGTALRTFHAKISSKKARIDAHDRRSADALYEKPGNFQASMSGLVKE